MHIHITPKRNGKGVNDLLMWQFSLARNLISFVLRESCVVCVFWGFLKKHFKKEA